MGIREKWRWGIATFWSQHGEARRRGGGSAWRGWPGACHRLSKAITSQANHRVGCY